MIKNINVTTLKSWLENNEAVLIDVRESEEYRVGRIFDAPLIPVGVITKGLLPEIGDKKLVLYCRSGKRSAFACEKLLGEGWQGDVYNLEGGILAWAQAGFELVN